MMQEIRHIRDTVARRRASRAIERTERQGGKWYLYVLLLVVAALLLAFGIEQLGMMDDAGHISAPAFLAAAEGGLTSYTDGDALWIVVLAQETLFAGRLALLGGILLALGAAGAFLLLRGRKRARRALLCVLFALLIALGGLSLVQALSQNGNLVREAKTTFGDDYAQQLRNLLNIADVSAQARLLLWRGALYIARFAILALGLALAAVGAWGLWRSREQMRLSRDAMSVRGYKRTVTVLVLVILLYTFAIVAFLGCFNVLGAFTNAAGLGKALNDYGSRHVTAAQANIASADKAITRAETKLREAQAELEEANAALAAAATEDEEAKAEKDIKSANKDIEKQTKNREEAVAERAEAVLALEEAEKGVTTYPGYSVSQLFTLADQLLPYRAQYGTMLEDMYNAMTADLADDYDLSPEEFGALARKVGGYNLTKGDLDMMRARYIVAAVGLLGLVAVIWYAKRRNVISLMFKHAFLSLFAFISVFPFYWIVVSATNTSMEITLGKLGPGRNLLVNFVNASFSGALGRSFGNSLRNALVITLGSLFVSSAAGYGFVVYQDKAKAFVLKLLMLSMMIPTAATLIPLFKLFSANNLNILNTTWAVVMPALATAFLIFMFRQGALSFPRDLIEAARIDGMGEFGIFVKMFMPVMRPTYAAAATVTFMNAWNAYLWPLVALTNTEAQTMPIYISNILEGYVMDFGQIMLAVTISTLPTVIIFFFLQKSFVEGIIGSVKQ